MIFANVTVPDGNTYYTSSWYGDYGHFATATMPWLLRGGDWSHGTMSGEFVFGLNTGAVSTYFSFRAVLTLQ